MPKLKKVAVTGAGGQIAYNLLFRIASGELFGPNEPLSLHLLEVPEMMPALEGIKMELEDGAFPLLREIKLESDPKKGFKDVTHAFLVGAKPRSPGMERRQLLQDNGKIFVAQGKALDEVADRNVKVLVVGNPCNTNCLIAMQNAPNLSKNNFFAMTRLDQNRAQFQLANKSGVPLKDVSHVTIWGNHSSTQVPDFVNAKIAGQPLLDKIKDKNWLENDFVALVQKRGAAVLEARGKSSAGSAANAALLAMQDICNPTPSGTWYSMGVWSENNPYGIDQKLNFSFPCRTKEDGTVEIVSGLRIDPFLEGKMKATEKELQQEKDEICQMSCLK